MAAYNRREADYYAKNTRTFVVDLPAKDAKYDPDRELLDITVDPVVLPTMRSFTIDQLGNVLIGLSNGDSFARDRVLVQNFRDPNALTRQGNNLFSGFEAAGPIGGINLSELNNSPGTNGLGRIEVGTLELSNVDLSQEFADMIVVQRSFQAGSRVITVSDTMLEEVINLKR